MNRKSDTERVKALFAEIGRDRISAELSTNASNLRNHEARGRIPASYFDPFERLLGRTLSDEERQLFGWKELSGIPTPSNDNGSEARAS